MPRDPSRRLFRWSPSRTARLLELALKREQGGSTADKYASRMSIYRSMARQLSEELRVDVPALSIKNQLAHLKDIWRRWLQHCNHVSDWSSSRHDKASTVEDHVEDAHFTAHPECLRFKRRLIEHYDALKVLFGDRVVHGTNAATASQSATSDEDDIVESNDEMTVELSQELYLSQTPLSTQLLPRSGSTLSPTRMSSASSYKTRRSLTARTTLEVCMETIAKALQKMVDKAPAIERAVLKVMGLKTLDEQQKLSILVHMSTMPVTADIINALEPGRFLDLYLKHMLLKTSPPPPSPLPPVSLDSQSLTQSALRNLDTNLALHTSPVSISWHQGYEAPNQN